MNDELPDPGITGRRTFRVESAHTTNLFGEQGVPPGLPAAADATAAESVRVLGTPHLLAEVEFLGRGSLRGQLPEGTGVVGIDAEVTHKRAVPIGTEVLVETELTGVADRTLTIEGGLTVEGSGDPIGDVTNRLRVVRREEFADPIPSE